MSHFESINITTNDSAAIDAFGRWRTSMPFTIFDSKLLHDNEPLIWDESEVSGSGTTSAHNSNTASVTMSVSASTGKRVRQTKMRFNYQPGKSQLVLMTGVFGTGSSNIIKRLGYFDDNNGIFFEQNGTTMNVVKRSFITGVQSDTIISQTNWNIDKMDGTGKSGLTFDPSKTNIFLIDIEWLGVGRVRMGLVINGLIYYVHQFLHANSQADVYMSTPNLPLRYEIANIGGGSPNSIKQICTSVSSEGGLDKNGILLSQNTGTSPINANSIGISYAAMGLRLKNTHLGVSIDLVRLSAIGATASDNFIWELLLNPTVAGTFNYNGIANTSVEIAIGDTSGNPSVNTVTSGTIIDSGVVRDTSTGVIDLSNALRIGSTISGNRDTIVLAIKPLTSNSDFHATLTWRELR